MTVFYTLTPRQPIPSTPAILRRRAESRLGTWSGRRGGDSCERPLQSLRGRQFSLTRAASTPALSTATRPRSSSPTRPTRRMNCWRGRSRAWSRLTVSPAQSFGSGSFVNTTWRAGTIKRRLTGSRRRKFNLSLRQLLVCSERGSRLKRSKRSMRCRCARWTGRR